MRERTYTVRSEIGLIRTAVAEGWDVPPRRRRREVGRLLKLLRDPASPPRTALAAARVLQLMARRTMAGAQGRDRAATRPARPGPARPGRPTP